MNIGLISDTHGHMDNVILKSLSDCDEIWHAGDWGDVSVADQLSEIAPLRGVYGNIDDEQIRGRYPLDERFDFAGVDVWISHIVGRPGRYESRVNRVLKEKPPGLLICGHSHILHVEEDKKNSLRYINPGAAGHHGLHTIRTIMKIQISDGEISRIRVLELGTRGKRK